MLLKHVDIMNLCQHKRKKFDLQPGLIGIVGPNGCGKSNFVKLIEASLINEFGFKGRRKEEQIRRGSSDDKMARIITVWEHGGVEFEITRSLRPNKSSLRIGNRKITKGPEITAELREILGAPYDFLQNYVFVDQGNVTSFLTAKPADRKAEFARQCGADHIEKIWQEIGNQLVADAGLDVVIPDNTQALRDQILANKEQLAQLRDEINDLSIDVMRPSEVVRLQTLISSAGRIEELREQLAEAEVKLPALRAKLQSQEQHVKLELDKLKKLREEQNGLDVAYHTALTNKSQHADLVKKRGRRQLLLQRLEVEPAVKPEEPERYDERDKLTEEVLLLAERLEEARLRIAIFDEKGVTACPTCGTATSNLLYTIKDARRVVETGPQQLEEMRQLRLWHREYAKDLAAWEQKEQERVSSQTAAAEELKQLPAVRVPSMDDLNEVIARYTRLTDQITDQFDNSNLANLSVGETRAKLNELENTIQSRQEKLASLTADVDKVTEAKEKLARHEASDKLLAGRTVTLNNLRARTNELISQFKQVQLLKKRTHKGRKWLADLRSWREVVHRDNLPRIYMASVLEDLVDHVNELLDEFDSPFQVSAGSDISFTVHNPDGTAESAVGKSGGEMTVLAIVYRLAANSRFAREIGMMVLDEPSAFLDTKNLGCLANVLHKICEVMQKRRQQLIMITHDQRLERVFNQLIELG